MARSLPPNARKLSLADPSAKELYRRLEKFHGISPALAGDRLHALKGHFGRSADDNVLFDLTGNIYDPDTLEWLGSLTAGGAKR